MIIISFATYYFCFFDHSFPKMTTCPAYAKVNTQTITKDYENVQY